MLKYSGYELLRLISELQPPSGSADNEVAAILKLAPNITLRLYRYADFLEGLHPLQAELLISGKNDLVYEAPLRAPDGRTELYIEEICHLFQLSLDAAVWDISKHLDYDTDL